MKTRYYTSLCLRQFVVEREESEKVKKYPQKMKKIYKIALMQSNKIMRHNIVLKIGMT